ncbi:MAG: metal ABC transporter permease, partial [Simkaniaceae bacterium]|nr:metal ABC transporter permease [Simkaniaceae bacterium]
LLFLLLLIVVIGALALLFHRKFLMICFDEDQAYLQGVSSSRLYFLLLSMIAVTVVALVQVIGAILIIAMLCLPAATANLFNKRLSKMIFSAIFFSLIFSILGTLFSYLFNWPPGATIALTSTVGYLLSVMIKR